MRDIPAETVAVQQSHRRLLGELFAGRAAQCVPSVARIAQCEYLDATPDRFAAWLDTSIEALDAGLPQASDTVTFRPLVVEFWPLGVHFVDALFGARVYEKDGNFWSDDLPSSLGDLAPPDVGASPLVRWTFDSIGQAIAALPHAVSVTTPVFSSPLNIAVNLFGEQALLDLSRPGKRELRGMEAIADAIESLHRLARDRFPASRCRFYASSHRYAPDGFGHICGCTTQLLGPETYARYVAPLDERILRTYPHGGTIHLCGHHTQHIPRWRKMPCLRGVQLNDAAADDFPAYLAGLRDDQIIYITPTPRMPLQTILALSGGRRIVLQTKLDRRIPVR